MNLAVPTSLGRFVASEIAPVAPAFAACRSERQVHALVFGTTIPSSASHAQEVAHHHTYLSTAVRRTVQLGVASEIVPVHTQLCLHGAVAVSMKEGSEPLLACG